MFSTFGQLFQWVKKRVQRTTGYYLGIEETNDSEPDTDVIIQELNTLIKALTFRDGLNTEEMEDIVTRIGHMSYMGSYEASRTAGTSLPEMIGLLKNKKTPLSLKEKLIMAISEICYFNRDNQNRTTGALPCLIEIMGNSSDIFISRYTYFKRKFAEVLNSRYSMEWLGDELCGVAC